MKHAAGNGMVSPLSTLRLSVKNLDRAPAAGDGLSQTASYLGLRTGLNLERWHLRSNSSLNWQSGCGDTHSTHRWQ